MTDNAHAPDPATMCCSRCGMSFKSIRELQGSECDPSVMHLDYFRSKKWIESVIGPIEAKLLRPE